MSLSRRKILQAGLGASQLALLGGLGLRPRAARAGGDKGGPTRLLTIYVNGGWMPELFFTPLTSSEIDSVIPPPEVFLGEPCFYESSAVANLDGTGDDPDPEDESLRRIRAPHQWDVDALSAGGTVAQDGVTTPIGWSWMHDNLFERACIVHGIDVGTAAHLSGKVSMMCGVAGPKYRSPAMHAFVAEAYADRFPERPLQSVSVAQGLVPDSVGLGPAATPTRISSTASLENALSERSDIAWGGLRDREPHPQFAFDGGPISQAIDTNAIDEFVLARSRRLYGTVNSGTNRFYEDFYETYKIVSKQLALDLVTKLEQTAGWENFDAPWANPNGPGPGGVKFGLANGGDSGSLWSDSFDLTLKLFKADLCSAISLEVPGVDGFHFDTHAGETGAKQQYLHVRAVLEIIGRLLHELQATPSTGGKSLLDDTVVLVFSEFSRTWPGTACDHWPATSVVMAGGGIAGNRQVGSFDLNAGGYSPIGMPIPLRNEGGGNDIIERAPKSADVVYTVLQLLGIEDVFIPGGVAEILGVRA